MTRAGAARRPMKRPARALLFIAFCFLGSAAVRIGDIGVTSAAAEGALSELAQAALPAPREPTVLRPIPEERRARTLGEQAAACDAPPGPLLEAIRERVAAIEAREAAVADRERLLEVAQARVRAEIDVLEAAEEQLARTLALADGASERDVAHLVGVYETMKAKDAAGIFAAMEPRFAAGFLSRMRADAAAGILAAMQPERAYAVSAVMAARNVGALRD
ncbi:MAG: hypothetical protein EA355_10600 [Rhodobacteraceae bacterium]|nr:MAG: hypothetical protein EA355_10600 [Paracoccaceae bacterium]